MDQRDATGLPLGFRIDFLEGLAAVNHVTRAHASARRAVEAAPSTVWEGVALAAVGQGEYLMDRPAEAVRTLRRSVGRIPDTNPVLLAVAVGNLALAEADLDAGSSRAELLLDDRLRVLSSIGAGGTTVAAVLHLACGERDRRAGDLRAADEQFTTAIDLLEGSAPGTWLALAHLLRAQVLHAVGDSAAATSSVKEADEILDRIPDPGSLRERSARLAELTRTPARVTAEYGEQLSDRELAVLRLAAKGLEQRQIAEQLYISYNTVKTHLKTSYRKLGVSSRAAAIDRLRLLESEANGAGHRHPGEQSHE
jgi:LuxR family transcriptional regulator, maltose regulon positive regulatory protein